MPKPKAKAAKSPNTVGRSAGPEDEALRLGHMSPPEQPAKAKLFRFNGGFYDYLSISAFSHLEDEFEAAATAAFDEITGRRTPFQAFDRCEAFMRVESKSLEGSFKTCGVGPVAIRHGALDAAINICNRDWWGKTRPHQRRLFQSLMTELATRYAAWAEKKGLIEDAHLLRDGFALALEKFKSKQFATRAKRAQDPYAPGGCCYDPDLIEVMPAEPKAKTKKKPAKTKPRKKAPESRT